MATLLLIRPEAQSRRLLEALAARGLRPPAIISPVIEIRPRAVSLPTDVDLVLTSQNALAALPPGTWRAWCVGDRTAEAARAAGLEAISAGGDVEALLERLVAERPGPLVHLRGVHATGRLAERLRARGIEAAEVVAYDQAARPLSREASELLATSGAVVLPLYSPRSAALASGHAGDWRASIHAAAISPATAEAFRRPARMTIADAPDAVAMLDAVAQALAGAERSRLVDRGGAG